MTLDLDKLAGIVAKMTPGDWRAVYNPQLPGLGAEVCERTHGAKLADRTNPKDLKKKSRTLDDLARLPLGYQGIRVEDAAGIVALKNAALALIAAVRVVEAVRLARRRYGDFMDKDIDETLDAFDRAARGGAQE